MKHHALWGLRGREVEGQIVTRGTLIEKLEEDTPIKISITRQRHVADKNELNYRRKPGQSILKYHYEKLTKCNRLRSTIEKRSNRLSNGGRLPWALTYVSLIWNCRATVSRNSG